MKPSPIFLCTIVIVCLAQSPLGVMEAKADDLPMAPEETFTVGVTTHMAPGE